MFVGMCVCARCTTTVHTYIQAIYTVVTGYETFYTWVKMLVCSRVLIVPKIIISSRYKLFIVVSNVPRTLSLSFTHIYTRSPSLSLTHIEFYEITNQRFLPSAICIFMAPFNRDPREPVVNNGFWFYCALLHACVCWDFNGIYVPVQS